MKNGICTVSNVYNKGLLMKNTLGGINFVKGVDQDVDESNGSINVSLMM